ncbi:MAG: DNA alkylation repair protein [Actinomycetota bacterium]
MVGNIAGPWAREIAAAIAQSADPRRAAQERRYLKSSLDHLGTGIPALRRAVRAFLRAHPCLTRDDVVALAEALWGEPVHELRTAAVEVLTERVRLLEARDLALVERLVRGSGTWALVDGLAVVVAGDLIERLPALTAELDRWATDADFWVRRSALLALLRPLRRGEGDWDRFAAYADAMLDEREFFIRKAIGWVLRETGRRRPGLVYDWLEPRSGRASGVTLREAVKPLTPEQRERILIPARRRGRRSAAPRTGR